MPKPLRASIIATVSIQMVVSDEDELTDGVGTLEDGIRYALGNRLYRVGDPFEFSIETESMDGIEVLDYGDFAELEKCPICGTVFALKEQVAIVKTKGSCKYCPDPEQEELE
jgi:hypothetical protein